jgi:hypothetical protein
MLRLATVFVLRPRNNPPACIRVGVVCHRDFGPKLFPRGRFVLVEARAKTLHRLARSSQEKVRLPFIHPDDKISEVIDK